MEEDGRKEEEEFEHISRDESERARERGGNNDGIGRKEGGGMKETSTRNQRLNQK